MAMCEQHRWTSIRSFGFCAGKQAEDEISDKDLYALSIVVSDMFGEVSADDVLEMLSTRGERAKVYSR